jgi:hypothetical protein
MPNILELIDCRSKRKYLFEYDQSIIAEIKSGQHIFWDDVPDDHLLKQVIENKESYG